MIDPAAVWAEIEARWAAAARGGVRPFAPNEVMQANMFIFGTLFRPAQIVAEKDEDGAAMWQLHPRPDMASARSWVWVCPVRQGFMQNVVALDGPLAGGAVHEFVQVYRERAFAADIGFMAQTEALCGTDIIDLVAFSPDLARCYGRLCDEAVVLGHPQEPAVETRPVRLFRSVRKWVEGRCAGAVMVGSALENDRWLRDCAAGIVTDDLAHGKAVQKQLRRPYDGPSVLVAA